MDLVLVGNRCLNCVVSWFWSPLEITDLLCISTCIVSIWIDGDPSNFYSSFSRAEFYKANTPTFFFFKFFILCLRNLVCGFFLENIIRTFPGKYFLGHCFPENIGQ